jgi:hypothetical protein
VTLRNVCGRLSSPDETMRALMPRCALRASAPATIARERLADVLCFPVRPLPRSRGAFDPVFGGGSFTPARRAFDNLIAIACFRGPRAVFTLANMLHLLAHKFTGVCWALCFRARLPVRAQEFLSPAPCSFRQDQSKTTPSTISGGTAERKRKSVFVSSSDSISNASSAPWKVFSIHTRRGATTVCVR